MPSDREVPQPGPSRLTPFRDHPLVVGVTLDQPELVPLTAALWAAAFGDVTLYFAYVDPNRITVEEFPDGSVAHADIDPDLPDQDWREREWALVDRLTTTLAGHDVRWEFRYLAGRVDRALTHLARAVDASAFVVGTRHPGLTGRVHEFLDGSVAARLAHHQHRPVLVVPLRVVDWHDRTPWQ